MAVVASDLSIDKNEIGKEESTIVRVRVTNTGDYDGKETVQMYIRDNISSVSRPVIELKGFKKVKLEPGEKETLTFKLEKRDLSFYDEKNSRWKAEKGKFNILVGSSSRDIRLQGEIEYLG